MERNHKQCLLDGLWNRLARTAGTVSPPESHGYFNEYRQKLVAEITLVMSCNASVS